MNTRNSRKTAQNTTKFKMALNTDDNTCTERVCKRKAGYVENSFTSFTFSGKIHDATVHVNSHGIENPYNVYSRIECVKFLCIFFIKLDK